MPLEGSGKSKRGILTHTVQALDAFGEVDLGQRLEKAVADGEAHCSLLYRCYRWLKPTKSRPPERLVADGAVLPLAESHEAWRRQVATQREWPFAWDQEFHSETERRVKSILGRSWARRGEGEFDADVSQVEVVAAVHD